MGAQASWLAPTALLALVGGLWVSRKAPRTDRTRAALLLWGGWLLVTAAVFSFGQGVIHTYYTVALAPAIAALVAIGAALCWSRRDTLAARLAAALAVAASAGWAYTLLARTPTWEPWLAPLILATAALAVLALLLAPALARDRQRLALAAAAALAALTMTAGPIAYAADTIATPHTGSIPSAGPPSALGAGAFGGGPRAGAPGAGARGLGGAPAGALGSRPGGPPRGGAGAMLPLGGATGGPGTGAGGPGAGAPGVGAARAGGPGGTAQTSAALVKALRRDATAYRWVAATSGSQSAAALELASDEPVMAIGGFDNQGGNLRLAAFQRYLAKREIHYYIASAGGRAAPAGGRGAPGGGPGGGGTSSAITAWVQSHFTAQTIGGQTVYDLTRAGS
jgi:4-amino-4-deoxy-L-arabinose transferase-like glycosyltransferase